MEALPLERQQGAITLLHRHQGARRAEVALYQQHKLQATNRRIADTYGSSSLSASGGAPLLDVLAFLRWSSMRRRCVFKASMARSKSVTPRLSRGGGSQEVAHTTDLPLLLESIS